MNVLDSQQKASFRDACGRGVVRRDVDGDVWSDVWCLGLLSWRSDCQVRNATQRIRHCLCLRAFVCVG